MANFSSSFMEYLKIYNPAAFEKANSEDIKPEELTSIYNANVAKYEIWESIPAAIRNRYLGQPVPQDVWEAATRGEIYTLQEMELHPEIKQVQEAREQVAKRYAVPADIISDAATATFVAALAAGYGAEACHRLALNRQLRENMLKNKPANMTDAQKAEWMRKWLDTRQKDFNTIKKDWAERQPEKLLMHLLAKHNHGKLKPEDAEKFPQIIEDLVQKINSPENNRMPQLLAYLKTPRVQARIGRFNEETLNILAHGVLQKLPKSEQEQYLAKDFSRRSEELQNLPDNIKAKMISDSINMRAVNLPEKRTLTPNEQYANMPSAFNNERSR